MIRELYLSRQGLVRCPECQEHVRLEETIDTARCDRCGAVLLGDEASDGSGLLVAARRFARSRSGLLAASLLGLATLGGCDERKVGASDQGVSVTDGASATDGASTDGQGGDAARSDGASTKDAASTKDGASTKDAASATDAATVKDAGIRDSRVTDGAKADVRPAREGGIAPLYGIPPSPR